MSQYRIRQDFEEKSFKILKKGGMLVLYSLGKRKNKFSAPYPVPVCFGECEAIILENDGIAHECNLKDYSEMKPEKLINTLHIPIIDSNRSFDGVLITEDAVMILQMTVMCVENHTPFQLRDLWRVHNKLPRHLRRLLCIVWVVPFCPDYSFYYRFRKCSSIRNDDKSWMNGLSVDDFFEAEALKNIPQYIVEMNTSHATLPFPREDTKSNYCEKYDFPPLWSFSEGETGNEPEGALGTPEEKDIPVTSGWKKELAGMDDTSD